MNAITLEQPGEFVRTDQPEPGLPSDGEALVAVHAIGVCGTDIHAFHGRQPFFEYPRILGHELGVEILAAGSGVNHIKPGDRCSVEPYLNCGRCVACRRGKTNCCQAMRVLGVHVDGGMRERMLLPACRLHPSAALDFEQLALIETLAIGFHAVERAAVEAGEEALVIGAGPIGLSVIQFLLARGANVTVADISPQRLGFCRESLGVSHTLDVGKDNLANAMAEITNGDFPTAVFDATGHKTSMQSAFGLVAHGGRLTFVGLFQGDVTFNDPQFHRRELTLLASRNALSRDFPRIIDLVANGQVSTQPWITHRGRLSEVPGLFPDWTKPEAGVVKAVIKTDVR
jgi:2-desacetyl-2-hydroxyethyl bacteriochlorophyllide A dehydrogenase